MKLLFNLEVIEGNRVKAEIGIATAKEFLDKLQKGAARIYTGERHE